MDIASEVARRPSGGCQRGVSRSERALHLESRDWVIDVAPVEFLQQRQGVGGDDTSFVILGGIAAAHEDFGQVHERLFY